jgi:hypothetical protein
MAAPEGNRLLTYLLAFLGGGAQVEFSPWRRADYIDDQPQQAPRKGGEGDDYEIRYRVQRAD